MGRQGGRASPRPLSLAVSRAAASGRPGCAASLRAALAHGPLRNRQRRGFPRGGSLAATITHQPAPPRLTKWRRPWSRRRPLPGPILCEARDLSTWNTSAEDAADCKACGREPSPRGPRYTRGRRRTPPPPPAPRASSPSSRREASEAAGVMATEGRGGPRPAAPGTRGGVTAGRVIRRDRGVVRCEAAWPLVRAGERGGPGSGSAESRRGQRRPRRPGGPRGDRGDEGCSLASKSSERRPGTVC